MIHRFPKQRRSGTILPLLAVCMIGLAGFCGLAIDLGLLAVARTQAQNAADTAALSACRLLNGKSTNSNLPAAYAESRTRAKANFNLNQKYTDTQIKKVEVGQYLYDASSTAFAVYNGAGVLGWKDASANPTPSSGQWTAIRVTLSTNQPTYFMRVFGVNTMPTGAKATAVYRPRDVAFVLDMTGSMGNSCLFNNSGASFNPDTNVPVFAHYNATSMASTTGNGTGSTGMIATGSQYASGSGVLTPSNYTTNTNGGPPLVDCFYWDPGNLGSMTSISTLSGPPPLNAFKRWDPPADYSGYDATHKGNEGSPKGPVPAPPSFASMTDAGALKYVGDRYCRADGSINKTEKTWKGDSATASTRAALNALELLGYGLSGGNVLQKVGGSSITSVLKFRDPIWEENGYDLDVKQYRTDRANGNPKPPNSSAYRAPIVATEDKFKGYSMGPGYYGKTFFIWPPDPRWGSDARTDLTGNTPYGDGSPDPTKPAASGVKDTTGNWICDWRLRFFYSKVGTNTFFDPQGDNKSGSTGGTEGVNEALFNTGSSAAFPLATGTANWAVNYTAVLKWIKSGPLVLPPNLRAGRVVYYKSIPDDVNYSANSTSDVDMDKAFWKRYIDFVLGYNRTSSTSNTELYGNADKWTGDGTWGTSTINTSDMAVWTGPTTPAWPSRRPYMAYNDNATRPRLHFWFGPLSMVDFLFDGNVGSGSAAHNWNPGTCTESQCWQLKAGMNSVIDDVKNNHPNHYIGLTMFSANYNDIRSPMGGGTQVLVTGGAQHSVELKNALFYPKSLLTKISKGDVTTEIRPFTSSGSTTSASFPLVDVEEIPNAGGSTDPMTGLAYAFNLLSPSAPLASTYPQYGSITNMGRRGAAKVVIFETDGVPNATRSGGGYQALGYNSYYKHYDDGTNGSSYPSAGTPALDIIDKMQLTISTTTSGSSGMSLPNAPCRVYPIAFGDLFDNTIVAKPPLSSSVYTSAKGLQSDALEFLSDIASHGKTGISGAAVPSNQIITGAYDTRISTLKTCMENIFQSGVAVTLVE